jgi:hypothetical protein
MIEITFYFCFLGENEIGAGYSLNLAKAASSVERR